MHLSACTGYWDRDTLLCIVNQSLGHPGANEPYNNEPMSLLTLFFPQPANILRAAVWIFLKPRLFGH